MNCVALATCCGPAESGAFCFLFALLGGVMQGCPLSGTLWCVSLDPVVRALLVAVGDEGLLSACADDVGMLLLRLARMAQVAEVFTLVQKLAKLTLAVKKCVMVPLWAASDAALAQALRARLAE
eukprot:2221111-Pyramimonas_sp.AAC.1